MSEFGKRLPKILRKMGQMNDFAIDIHTLDRRHQFMNRLRLLVRCCDDGFQPIGDFEDIGLYVRRDVLDLADKGLQCPALRSRESEPALQEQINLCLCRITMMRTISVSIHSL